MFFFPLSSINYFEGVLISIISFISIFVCSLSKSLSFPVFTLLSYVLQIHERQKHHWNSDPWIRFSALNRID